MKQSRRETLPATNSRSKVAPGEAMLFRVRKSWNVERCIHTSVVDENVDVAWTCLDLLESFLDRLVTCEIDLDNFSGVGRFGTFFMEGLDGKFRLLRRTTAKEDVIGIVGSQQRLDGLVTDAIVTAGDEYNLWRRHCRLISFTESLSFVFSCVVI